MQKTAGLGIWSDKFSGVRLGGSYLLPSLTPENLFDRVLGHFAK